MNAKVWPPVLDWKASTHWDFDAAEMDDPGPCVLCGAPSLLLSDKGEPCHKTCAEAWFEQHPEAWAAYEEQRDAKKKSKSESSTIVPTAARTDALFTQAA